MGVMPPGRQWRCRNIFAEALHQPLEERHMVARNTALLTAEIIVE